MQTANGKAIPLSRAELFALQLTDEPAFLRTVQRALNGRTAEEAAEKLGVGRRTIFRWLKRYPSLAR